MTTPIIKQGTIKYPAGDKSFTSKFSGEQQKNIVVSMEDGTEEKIYFKVGRQPHESVQKGQHVQILYEQWNGKTVRKLIAPSVTPAPTSPATNFFQGNKIATNDSVNPQKFVESKIEQFLSVYTIVKDHMPEEFTHEDLRTITTSILIEGSRKGVDFGMLMPPVVPEEAQPQREDSPDSGDVVPIDEELF